MLSLKSFVVGIGGGLGVHGGGGGGGGGDGGGWGRGGRGGGSIKYNIHICKQHKISKKYYLVK